MCVQDQYLLSADAGTASLTIDEQTLIQERELGLDFDPRPQTVNFGATVSAVESGFHFRLDELVMSTRPIPCAASL